MQNSRTRAVDDTHLIKIPSASYSSLSDKRVNIGDDKENKIGLSANINCDDC